MYRIPIVILFLFLCSCKGNQTVDTQVATVKKGVFLEELYEEGSVEAVNSIAVTAPNISYRYGSLKITYISEDGEEVEKGDTIIIFDPAEIKKAIIQAEQQLEIAEAEYEKMKSVQRSEIEDLEADLELAKISQEISKINYETSVYEPEATKKEINLKLESATIALNRALEQIENKKNIHKEDLVQKSLSMKQYTVTLADAKNSMNNLFVKSPVMGITIKKDNWTTGQKWATGDQPYSGSGLIELPDLSVMRARISINEVDVSKIKPGLKVEVRPDAYSDSVYTGRVESVAILAQNKDNKSKIKVFPVMIRIDGQSKKLLPGLTVSCRIIVSEIPDVLYVPLESIFREPGAEYVYLKTGSGFRRQDIKTGSVNSDYAVVTEGLVEDDVIALSDPFPEKEKPGGEKENVEIRNDMAVKSR